jgi:hypothetical protein
MTDTLWMLSPDAYLRLVRDAGWPVERFETWLADVTQRLFLMDGEIDTRVRASARPNG